MAIGRAAASFAPPSGGYSSGQLRAERTSTSATGW